MKGLILKEIFLVQSQFKLFIVLLLAFAISPFFQGDVGLVLTFYSIIGVIIVTRSLEVDEISQWNRFANTLPVKRSEVVKSKYVFSISLLLCLTVILTPVIWLSDQFVAPLVTGSVFSLLCVFFTLVMFALSFVIPVYIKFGAIKGRFFLLFFAFIPAILLNLLSDYFTETHYLFVYNLLKSALAPIIALIVFTISYMISVKAFENKEF
jgi:ABC-2 type transport system permease protein